MPYGAGVVAQPVLDKHAQAVDGGSQFLGQSRGVEAGCSEFEIAAEHH
jgi:hypothetical protein